MKLLRNYLFVNQETLRIVKINNKIISSLDSLKVNFDFCEIWNKKEIAIRDLSPALIHYPNKKLLLYYYAFANPSKVNNENGTLVLHLGDDDFELNLDITDKRLKGISFKDQIQILALFKLANIELCNSITGIFDNKIGLDNDVIILNNGQSISISKNDNTSAELVHKAIIVDPSSKKKSIVGNYFLEPGQGTFGIFCDGELITVAPPFGNNTSYYFEYELVNDTLSLTVKDAINNTQVAKYNNAHFYAIIGENDFIVINGLIVSCFNNERLDSRLRQCIVKAKSPEYIKSDDKSVTIVYKDNSQDTIEI